MGGEWRETTIGALCDAGVLELQTGPFGSQLHASDYVAEGVPVVPTEAIRDRRIEHSVLPQIRPEKASLLERHRLRLGDILFARRGVQATGQVALVREAEVGSLCGTGAIRLRINEGRTGLDSGFLSHVFANPASITWFKHHAIGATMPNLNEGIIRAFPLRFPDIEQQREIARVLDALEDKIELNRRLSETLEDMALILFSSSVAGVMPVRTKVLDLRDARILEIGDGYRAKNSELGGPGLPFIRAGDLNRSFDTSGADTLSLASISRAGSKLSRPGDVAFTSKGTIGRFARVSERTPRFVYSPQVCYWRSLDRQRLHPSVLYCWMRSEDARSQMLAVAGQTDMAPYVSLRDQLQMEIPLPIADQSSLGLQLDTLFGRQDVLREESSVLAGIRNRLLPHLLSQTRLQPL